MIAGFYSPWKKVGVEKNSFQFIMIISS